MYSFKRFYEKLIKIQIGKRARLFYRKISIAQINFSIIWSWISSLIDISDEIETAALPNNTDAEIVSDLPEEWQQNNWSFAYNNFETYH